MCQQTNKNNTGINVSDDSFALLNPILYLQHDICFAKCSGITECCISFHILMTSQQSHLLVNCADTLCCAEMNNACQLCSYQVVSLGGLQSIITCLSYQSVSAHLFLLQRSQIVLILALTELYFWILRRFRYVKFTLTHDDTNIHRSEVTESDWHETNHLILNVKSEIIFLFECLDNCQNSEI